MAAQFVYCEPSYFESQKHLIDEHKCIYLPENHQNKSLMASCLKKTFRLNVLYVQYILVCFCICHCIISVFLFNNNHKNMVIIL